MPRLEEVFGVTVKTPLSYIYRENVDAVFKSHIRSDKHIVVYGASKQGKSTLVAKHIENKDKLVTHLSPGTTRLSLYASILRELGVELNDETVLTKKRTAEFQLGAKIKALIPFVGAAGVENKNILGTEQASSVATRSIALDLASADDVGKLMQSLGKNKIYILENFHYADEQIQRELAFDLRTFHDLEIQFVILGVWREKNRLVQYNGDLLSRLVEVPVEPWTKNDFKKIAIKGSKELNVHFVQDAVEECINHSCSSIAVFQELMKALCMKSNVLYDTIVPQKAGDPLHVQEAVSELSKVYETRHTRVLETIASICDRTKTGKRMKGPGILYYLVCAVLKEGARVGEQGFSREQIEKTMNGHRKKFGRAHITNMLKRLTLLQYKYKISPPVLDYDVITRRITVVDSTFLFYLKNLDLARTLGVITDLYD